MIETNDLTKMFDDLVAVDSVNLKVNTGQVLGLLGPNGAGKTTTVRMLTSILRPTRGSARVAGYDVVTQADQVRASVGVLTENHGLYNRMTGQEYLDFYGRLYGLDLPTIQKRTGDMLDRFGLAEAARRRLGEYSKGMRQKLALVRALLHEPPVLLLDEPTSALDPASAHTVREAICTLRSSDRTIVLCTHNLAEVEALADQIAIIRRGKIIFYDSVEGLKHRLLGADEYQLNFAGRLDGWEPIFPESARMTGHGVDWLRYTTENPRRDNPVLAEQCVHSSRALVTLQEVPHSLEDAYLKAINQPETGVGV